MESTEKQSGLLHRIIPPRLEDAGLEDPALPPESIHEAFLKAAAAAVKSSAASIFSGEGDTGGDCVKDPWEGTSDAVVGIEPESEPPGPCTVEKGCEAVADQVRVGGGGDVEEVGDEVVVVGEGAKLGEEGEACVDELQGLDIKDKEDVKKSGVDVDVDVGGEDGEKDKKPTLVEGYV